MLTALEAGRISVTPRNLFQRKSPVKILNAVLDEDTGELLEYGHLMKNPKYRKLWGKSYGNELGRLAQLMSRRVERTNTISLLTN